MGCPSYITRLPDERFQATWPRRVAILGSTGSIGASALRVVRSSKGRLIPCALAGGENLSLLAAQAEAFRPNTLAVKDEHLVARLIRLLPKGYTPTILHGQAGYETIAALPEADVVLSAQSGAAGLRATYAAVCAGKVIALANKESLVMAGLLIRQKAAETGACILPVDSEHNAIFQCLAGEKLSAVSRLVITASGGPFFGKKREELRAIAPATALAHPNWSMGAKISIDSATLMNKGLEIIEAHHLYGMPLDKIDVAVHRQSIVHSLVEYADGSHIAQLGTPDMRTAIGHCLLWPERLPCGVEKLDLLKVGQLTFEAHDDATFPCLSLARRAQTAGNNMPVALNAANEIAVEAFLDARIPFLAISAIIEETLGHFQRRCKAGENFSLQTPAPSSAEASCLEDLLLLDAQAREYAQHQIAS